MKKQQYKLEFIFKYSSFSALWEMITTTDGLEQWFADKALMKEGNTICFVWDEKTQKANIKNIKINEYIRFHWEGEPEKQYFEFRISKNELTGELTLTITDFAYPQYIEDDKALWETNVSILRRLLGV